MSAIGIEFFTRLLLLLHILQPESATFLDWECGLRPQPLERSDLRIINGKNATTTSSPWMVLLLTPDGFFVCGGSLITNLLVLTAAHCYDLNRNLKARFGEYNRDLDNDKCLDTVDGDVYCAIRVEINVDFAIMHPRYNPKTFANDIAILRLVERLEFTDRIRPICIVLNKDWRDSIDGLETLTATGWGVTTANGESSRILQTLQIKRSPPQTCSRYMNRTPLYNEFCLGNKDSGICNGDSGGPVGKLIRYDNWPRFIQIGIASHTNLRCAYASVFTDVLSHVNWIVRVDERYGDGYIRPNRARCSTRRYRYSY